ncbi:MAG TPA: L,D-transpeptidase family protein [Candidatus Paceibacterota bacterium]|nr:L,D-transpeptidase family protein [Candidatus Paceibacterota bacterium]
MGTYAASKPLFVIALAAVAGLSCLLLLGPVWLGPSAGLPAAIVAAQDNTASTTPEAAAVEPSVFNYIEITNGCGPYYDTGVCVNMRSGPGVSYPVVGRLRTGVVLKVEKATTQSQDGLSWYKIIFDGEIRYPERVTGDWYVAVDPTSVLPIENIGDEFLTKDTPPTTKRIVVDLSQQMLYAYDGDTLFMQDPISTGLDGTPTPIGTFHVFKKTPSRYMQGPIPGVSDQYYDLPGVPWNLYFTNDGAVIHGAYWHNHFGEPWSHGCVNLAPQEAKKLYMWADVGTTVTVVQN